MTPDLLPPNATPLERALSVAIARPGAITFDLVALWNPWTCPIALLPWLAWSLSTDRWDPEWSEAEKRAAVARTIEEHRHKGTRWSVERVLARFDALLELVEWHETTPRMTPHTFEVRLPLVDADGATGGARVSAAVARAIIAEVSRAKPAREHFRLVQQLAVDVSAAPIAALQGTGFVRLDADATNAGDVTPWAALLQDQNGEPLEDDLGNVLDGSPA